MEREGFDSLIRSAQAGDQEALKKLLQSFLLDEPEFFFLLVAGGIDAGDSDEPGV